MTFDAADEVESLCYQFRLADWPRSRNRALINNLFNGVPPYPVDDNENVNVNFLEGTRLAHDARSQFYQAFLKPGNYFTATTDAAPVYRRQSYSTTVTKEVNRLMKKSLPYFECFRSKFALLVLHGIAPAGFNNSYTWCPEPFGCEDVYVPSNTKLTMHNLPFFAIYRQFTAPELIKLTQGKSVDPAWNQPLAKRCIEWIDRESAQLMGNNWYDTWTPEKAAERLKSDGGLYSGDQVPTINVWDFYFWNDDNKVAGWNRRMVLDSWSTPEAAGNGFHSMRRQGDIFSKKNGFLYNPGKRKWADKKEQIITWQFADLSAVAPFRYHSVRSLGFLMYNICHLQNRLRCRFSESVFESLLMYFRVKSGDDSQRALKVDLINRGFIDESLEFIKAQDRYQVRADLVALGLQQNETLISQNSSSYTTQPNQPSNPVEKTKFQVMSEVNAMTSLVSAALLQAYAYQNAEYYEVFRRFCKKDSPDPDVRTFQANCLRQRVPERLVFNPDMWTLEPERIMGAGNKTLEMAIAQQLMETRHLFDPEPQRMILKDYALAVTDDAARAEAYVPESPQKVTDSVHDAQLAAGTLMQGLPVAVKSGMNHIEYVETLMEGLQMIVQRGSQTGMATMEQIIGMNNMAQHIAQHIQLIAQDPNEKQRVKVYGDQLGKLMNEVKAFEQRLEEQMKVKAEQEGQAEDAATAAKIKASIITAEAKAANTRESHAQRTAQRQIQWQMEEDRKNRQFESEQQRENRLTGSELATETAFTRHDLKAEAAKTAQQLRHDRAAAGQDMVKTRLKTKAEVDAMKKKAAAAARAKPKKSE